MRTWLKNGRLTPPSSLACARTRQKQLAHEIQKIERQIADPGRVTHYATTADYSAWRLGAGGALKLFKSEARQLADWVEAHEEDAEVLLGEAHALLKSLREDLGDDDFDPEEIETIDRVSEYLERRQDRNQQEAG